MLLSFNIANAVVAGQGRYVVKPSFVEIIDYPFLSNYALIAQYAKNLVALCNTAKYGEVDKCITEVLNKLNDANKNFIWHKDKCPEEKDEFAPYYELTQAYSDCAETSTTFMCTCGSMKPEALGDYKIKLEQLDEDLSIKLFHKDDELKDYSKVIPYTNLVSNSLEKGLSPISKSLEIKKDSCPGDYCTEDKTMEFIKIGNDVAIAKHKDSKKLPSLPECNSLNIFVDAVPFNNQDYEDIDKSTIKIGLLLKERFSNNVHEIDLSFGKDTTGKASIRKLVATSAVFNSKAYIILAISDNINYDFEISYSQKGESLAFLVKEKINKTFESKKYKFDFRETNFQYSSPTTSLLAESGAIESKMPIIIFAINRDLINKYDEDYITSLANAMAEAINLYYLNPAIEKQHYKFCIQSKEEFYSYNPITKAIEKKPLEYKFALTIGRKYEFITDPEKIMDRLTEIAKDIPLTPELQQLAKAIALIENNYELSHFDDNGGVKVSTTLDHGVMQINEGTHSDCYDSQDTADGICRGVRCAGKTALDLDCNIEAALIYIKDLYDEKGEGCKTLYCANREREYCGIELVARKYNGFACCQTQQDPTDCGGYVARVKSEVLKLVG